jgi:hypothetical protein
MGGQGLGKGVAKNGQKVAAMKEMTLFIIFDLNQGNLPNHVV